MGRSTLVDVVHYKEKSEVMGFSREGIRRLFIVGAILYVCLITVLSLMNLSQVVPENEITYLDKLAHFCIYWGMEMSLLSCVVIVKGRLSVGWIGVVTLATIGYGVAIEFIQQFVGRDFDVYDIYANAVGAISGVLLFMWSGVAIVDAICSLLGVRIRKDEI